MVYIQIDRKLVKAVLIIVIAVSLGFNIYSYVQNKMLESRYNMLSCIADQFDKTNLISFVASASIPDYGHKDVEIFDISKGEVIIKVQSNSEIQREARQYLQRITGIYEKVKAFPENGYIIRVPLKPSVEIKNQLLNGYYIYSLDEVFIMFPAQQKPYLLVLDNKYRPFFCNFDCSTDKLLKILKLQPYVIKPPPTC